jgi:NADH-quinone oxidoreductase subunit F
VSEKILTRNFDRPDSHTLAVYRETGGYAALAKAAAMEPAAIVEEIKKSNLRGLGGA